MRNRLLVAAMVGVGASALMMACGGDDTFVAPEDEDSGATGDATTPAPDAAMGMVVDGGGTKDATTADAFTGPGTDATSGSDATSAPDTSTGDSGADATADAADASDAADAADANELDAADASDAADAGDAADAADSAVDAGTFLTPKCDGVIGATEYGPGVEGKDQYTTPNAQVWHMTWDATNLYLAVAVANVTEPVLLYFDTKTGGLTTPPGDYDHIQPGNLGIAADFLLFEKTSYQVTQVVSGGMWQGPVLNTVQICDNAGTGTTRELVIPWSLTLAGGPPTTPFQFFGYAEDGNGAIYSQIPLANSTNDTANVNAWFTVANATTPASALTAFSTITTAP